MGIPFSKISYNNFIKKINMKSAFKIFLDLFEGLNIFKKNDKIRDTEKVNTHSENYVFHRVHSGYQYHNEIVTVKIPKQSRSTQEFPKK